MWRGFSLVPLFFAAAVAAQTPAADWRTVETPHFRLHYPSAYEAFASRIAGKLEPIRDAVAAETGFAAPEKTEVLVMNPEALPNGLTYPLLDLPRIVLYAEPPGPGDEIGEFRDWDELLVVHEMTHLQHLLRPSRNPLRRAAERLLPLGPIAISAPRWVSEGYATVVEGRLTGSGRPASTIRAAILRKWAQKGQLPTYPQLSSDRRFLGMSMAYLAGSAYLEWLEERAGSGSLRHLWARMTARQRRSFADSFGGVFGDTPERLYGEFTAQLTERAVNVDRESASDLREGELWQETSRRSGDPAVSPDGKRLAVVIRNEHGESKLVIDSTGAPVEEESKFRRKIDRMLARDPEDVAPVRSKPLPRKELTTLELPLAGGIDTPRWMPGGGAMLFGHRSHDRNGDRHHDLYLWTIGSGSVVRVTHAADVSDADPLPDGRSAVGVRSRFGFSQLVSIDLATGEVTALNEPSLDAFVSHPRYRDGHIAFAKHQSGRWQLVVRDLASTSERVVPLEGNVATPEWDPVTGDLYAVVMNGGMADIVRIPQTPNSSAIAVTRMTGGAFEPAPSSDGRLFFMALEPSGYTLHVIDPVPAPPRTAIVRSLVPALPASPPTGLNFVSREAGPAHPYGVGRQERGLLFGGYHAPAGQTTEVGIRTGDVVGRLDAFALVAIGRGAAQHGAAIAIAWRGLPVELRAHLFTSKEEVRKAGTSESIDLDQRGVELSAVWRSVHETGDLAIESGALIRDRASLVFADARGIWRQKRSSETAQLAMEGGSTRHARLLLRGEISEGGIRWGMEGQHDEAWSVGSASDAILAGGIASSILPRAAVANRVLDPALPAASLTGNRYDSYRIDASLGPLTFFHRTHRLGDTVDVNGVEVRMRTVPMPLLDLPAIGVTAGAARVLGRNRWWLAVRLEP